MKGNLRLLTDQVRKNLMSKCTTAIITEAFINALPFDKDELSLESNGLTNYAINVIDKMNPECLLEKAMESTKENPNAHLYVQNLKSAIEEVVESATTRIVQESIDADNSIPEIVSQAKLNSDETEKFVKASKHSGTDAVSKLVKEKMIETIKNEKASYENEAKLHNDIKDIIKKESDDLKEEIAPDTSELSDSDDTDTTLESYLKIVLSPTDARHHVSVFSKMQDICIESVMFSNEKYDFEIPYKTLEKITLESTFPYFDMSKRSLMDELDAMVVVTESMEDEEHSPEIIAKKKKKVAKTAFICTICIMTLLEVLKTMHLAKPEMRDVRNFVDNPTEIKRNDLQNVEDKVGSVIADGKKSVALGAMNTVELSQVKESLEKVRGILENLNVPNSEISRKERIINKINSALEAMNLKAEESAITNIGSFTNYLKETNIANIEHGINIVSRRPDVRSVQINLCSTDKTSDNYTTDIEIQGLGANGIPSTVYMANVHAIPALGNTVAEVVKECATYCDLGKKNISLYFTDSRYSIPLKNQ